MPLTIHDTLTRVRRMGLTASYNHCVKEFRIDYRREDSRHHAGDLGSAYFTEDPDDALIVARLMSEDPPRPRTLAMEGDATS